MQRKFVWWLATALTSFSLVTVSASIIDLTGSDSAPGTGTTLPNCSGPLTINTPVSQGSGNRVTKIVVLGNMLNCAGQTMKVTVVVDNVGNLYGVHRFTVGTTQVELRLDETDGDFRDLQPIVIEGVLTPQGQLIGPVKLRNISTVDVVIASNWI
jgi:hypothetical protein